MISVIIPLMPIEPYKTIYKDAIEALEYQEGNVDFDIYIIEQPVEGYINKGRLLNVGVEKSGGDLLWFCDADFLPWPDLLKKMETKLTNDDLDVIYPMFYSNVYKQMKIADGAPFIKRSVLEKYGKFDETDLGISWITFPFLRWCMDNCKFHCSDEFFVDINETPQRTAGKRHWKTSGKLRGLYKETVKDLQEMGVWP